MAVLLLRVGDGVADRLELLLGVAAQALEGDDADDGDERQEERVLDQGGATLGLAETGLQVADDVPVHFLVLPLLGVLAPFRGLLMSYVSVSLNRS